MTKLEAPARPSRNPEGVTLITLGFHAARGGVESHVSALTKALAHRGTKVVVLTAERGIDRAMVERHHGCWVVSFPAWATSSMTVSPRLVWSAIRSRRGDRVLHVHGCHVMAVLALVGRRAPTVFTPHYHGRSGSSRVPQLRHAARYLLTKMLVRRCTAIICVSEAERRILIDDFPLVADRVTVIPNGIDAQLIRDARPEPAQPPTVVCVGRLEAAQRVDDVLQAFSEVPAPTQLVVIGDGSQRAHLTEHAEALGISDRVRLIGNAGDVETNRWLRTALVSVSMSESETLDMAPVEAACAGARVILSDTPAHREIADEFLRRCVTILTDCSPAAMAAEIRRQLHASRSDTCTAPDWRDVASRTVDVYRTVGVAVATPTGMNGDPHDADSFLRKGMGT